jgi:hypothetical protein
MGEPTKYLQHYIDISAKYPTAADVYRESMDEIRNQVRDFAAKEHYKYKIYTEINPNLEKSPFITNFHPRSRDTIRFRLGSHILPIETGRCSRKPRQDRLCDGCGVLVYSIVGRLTEEILQCLRKLVTFGKWMDCLI